MIGKEGNFLIGIQFRKVFLGNRILLFYGVKWEMMIKKVLPFKKSKRIYVKLMKASKFKVKKQKLIDLLKICIFFLLRNIIR